MTFGRPATDEFPFRFPRWAAAAALCCAVLLGCAVGVSMAGETVSQTPEARAAEEPREIRGVKNFAQVSPVLYRGAQPSAEGFAELKRLGIRTIVNFRNTSDRKALKGLGLRYLHISSDADEIDQAEVIRFLKVLEDPANHPVFVHCRRGADRTGCAVAAYRIAHMGWSAEEALREMQQFRFASKYENIKAFVQAVDPVRLKEAVRLAPPEEVKTVK